MRIGILADVHSNLEALQSVLKEIKKEGIDKYIFLGDAVGYGANPNECCEILRDLSELSILGNHDAACCGKMDPNWFVQYAKEAVEWTLRILTPQNLQWIQELPYIARFQGIGLCHGSPVTPQEFNYLLDAYEAHSTFRWMREEGCPVILVGHSHQPLIFLCPSDALDEIRVTLNPEFTMDEGVNYIISVGSVGQPRDSNYKAAYSIIDTEKKTYTLKRVDYDVKGASQKIQEAGLPRILSQRLFLGR